MGKYKDIHKKWLRSTGLILCILLLAGLILPIQATQFLFEENFSDTEMTGWVTKGWNWTGDEFTSPSGNIFTHGPVEVDETLDVVDGYLLSNGDFNPNLWNIATHSIAQEYATWKFNAMYPDTPYITNDTSYWKFILTNRIPDGLSLVQGIQIDFTPQTIRIFCFNGFHAFDIEGCGGIASIPFDLQDPTTWREFEITADQPEEHVLDLHITINGNKIHDFEISQNAGFYFINFCSQVGSTARLDNVQIFKQSSKTFPIPLIWFGYGVVTLGASTISGNYLRKKKDLEL